jgi:hypothetical protein
VLLAGAGRPGAYRLMCCWRGQGDAEPLLQACTTAVAAGAAAVLDPAELPAMEWVADAWGPAPWGPAGNASAKPLLQLRLDNVHPPPALRPLPFAPRPPPPALTPRRLLPPPPRTTPTLGTRPPRATPRLVKWSNRVLRPLGSALCLLPTRGACVRACACACASVRACTRDCVSVLDVRAHTRTPTHIRTRTRTRTPRTRTLTHRRSDSQLAPSPRRPRPLPAQGTDASLCLSAAGGRVTLDDCAAGGGWARDPLWGTLRRVPADPLTGGPLAAAASSSSGDCLTGLPMCPGPSR